MKLRVDLLFSPMDINVSTNVEKFSGFEAFIPVEQTCLRGNIVL